MSEIAIVGSLNLDIVVPVERHPAPGETVLGGDHVQLPGGKGANQAVAAARLGRAAAMVGRVGNDDAGARLRANLEREGVDTAHVVEDGDAPTGMALIAVGGGGENTIVVSPGANARVSPADVENAAELLATAKVTLVQLEIPPQAVDAAIAAAAGIAILNPAPARPLAPELLRRVDILVPNRSELALLTGGDADRPEQAAARIAGPRAIVVTLGADGALVVEGGRSEFIPAPPADVVDTTGAGDTFCGALADALAGGAELTEAARHAVAAASLSVGRRGAQAGMPTAEQLHLADKLRHKPDRTRLSQPDASPE